MSKILFYFFLAKTFECPSQGSCDCGAGETCDGGRCKCGNVPGCKNSLTAPFCDAENSVCKCASDVAACHINGETCQNNGSGGKECRCEGSGRSCSVITGETCDSNTGTCMCGTAASCHESKQGKYCDAANNMCRCSSSLMACVGSETCEEVTLTSGLKEMRCKCGNDDTCDGSAQAPYCDTTLSPNKCRCSSTVDACTGQQTCLGGKCQGTQEHILGLFIHQYDKEIG